MKSTGVKENEGITFENFKNIVLKPGTAFSNVSLETRSKRQLKRTFSLEAMEPSREDLDTDVEKDDEENKDAPLLNRLMLWYYGHINKIRSKVQYVFWVVLYTLVMLVIFAERAYYFS